MKASKLVYLMTITVVTIIVAMLVTQYRSPVTSKQKDLLFPELKNKINDVSEITVSKEDKTVTLIRNGNEWTINNAGGYPAIFEKIKQSVIAVANLKVLTLKTSKPSLYSKLGVEDPTRPGANSTLLTLKDASSKVLGTLIVGQTRRSKSAKDNPGFYVRLPDQDQALLVEGQLSIGADTVDWINRNPLNITSDRIREITIEQNDSPKIILTRETPEADFSIADIPSGKQIQSEIVLNRMQTILADVYITDVKSTDQVTLSDPISITTVKTYDGLVATISSATIDGLGLVQFSFAYDASNSQEPEQPEAIDGKEEESSVPDKAVQKETEELTATTEGWVYELPEYKFELFTKKLEDFIKDETLP